MYTQVRKSIRSGKVSVMTKSSGKERIREVLGRHSVRPGDRSQEVHRNGVFWYAGKNSFRKSLAIA